MLVRVSAILLCGLAWGCVVQGLAGLGQARTGAFVLLRLVREGINVLLPVASVGGDVVGGRLLTFWGVAGPLAAASILADMLFQVGTQALFALLGAGPAALGEAGVGTVGDALRLRLDEVVRLGDDVRLTLRPFRRSA